MEEENINAHSGEISPKEKMINSSLTNIPSKQDEFFGLKRGEIQHMVIFNLKYEKDTAQTNNFLSDGQRILSAIPVVKNFQVLKQGSIKNNYDFGFTMIFADREAYSFYNNHPAHLAFVEERWKKEVTRFLETDFEV